MPEKNQAIEALIPPPPPLGNTPLYGLYRYVRPQRVWFSAVLVINGVSNLAHSGHINFRVWFLHSSLNMGIFLRRSHFFIIIKKKINKSPSQIMFTVI